MPSEHPQQHVRQKENRYYSKTLDGVPDLHYERCRPWTCQYGIRQYRSRQTNTVISRNFKWQKRTPTMAGLIPDEKKKKKTQHQINTENNGNRTKLRI